ncbi:hypothetical protein BpHYR1_007904 [Brachionus plicatilis]|uniref:Uncharacterized protein n=1 Tax=Brachionus plicatilis TaxID=10195 RepID=A0A3M7QI64_BRAPC|nr:hypothetical protein BpHYR1_007904 [Brachionus plicatilis]
MLNYKQIFFMHLTYFVTLNCNSHEFFCIGNKTIFINNELICLSPWNFIYLRVRLAKLTHNSIRTIKTLNNHLKDQLYQNPGPTCDKTPRNLLKTVHHQISVDQIAKILFLVYVGTVLVETECLHGRTTTKVTFYRDFLIDEHRVR